MAWLQAQTSAAVYSLRFSPLRRGPFEFAANLSYVFLRSSAGDDFGSGDPKLFARARLPPLGSVRFAVEAAARLPLSEPDLYPFAFGGQEVEFSGAFAVGAPVWLAAGVGRILSEPPSDSDLASSDVPHATHAWLVVSGVHGTFVFAMHGDALLYELEGEGRGVLGASVAHRRPHGFAAVLLVDVEVGEAANRVFDYSLTLRFAIPLR